MLYHLSGIVDVGMYNSLLSPEVALDNTDYPDEAARARAWKGFDFRRYADFVCQRAVLELEAMFKRLPPTLNVRLVPGSARIVSPSFYNYTTDRLYFQITADSKMSESEMQAYLDQFFDADWNAEFGPDYRIYEYISGNLSPEEFRKPETEVERHEKPVP